MSDPLPIFPTFSVNAFNISHPDEVGTVPPINRIWVDLSAHGHGKPLRVIGAIKLPNPINLAQSQEIQTILCCLLTIICFQVDSSVTPLAESPDAPLNVVFLVQSSDLDIVFEYKVPRIQCCTACFKSLKQLIIIKWQGFMTAMLTNGNQFSQETNYFVSQFLAWIESKLS